MKRIALLLSVGCLLFVAGGCASYTGVFLSVNGEDKPVSMTSNVNKEYRVVKHFRVEQRSPLLFLVRMFPVPAQPDLAAMMRPDLIANGGDAVVNLKMTGEASLGDVLLPVGVGVFGGLVYPALFFAITLPIFEDLKTYTVEGDIVKYVEPNRTPEPGRKFDPVTGLPLTTEPVQFDPKTGLPVRP